MTIGSASLISSGTLVRFTRCPRFAFPIAGVLASLPAFAITCAAALVSAAIAGALSPRVVLLPLALAWLFMLTAGGVAMAASLAVRYRDIISAMPFLLQVGVFLAPVGYPLHSLGGTVRTLVELNPLTGLIELSRWMIVAGYHISPRTVIYSLVVTVVVAILGWLTFSRLETTMADEI
jgi:lipopolysaccharide transport system permease protein